MASNSNVAHENAAPESRVTPESIQTPDAATTLDSKQFFTKEDVSRYVKIGISAALEKLEADYESRLAALNERLNRVEDDNKDLRERLESSQMDAKLAQTTAEARHKKMEELQEKVQNTQVRYLETVKNHESEINDLEQYSRRSHIRIRGLRVQQGESYKGAVARFCSTRLRVRILESDLDDAHPLPSRTTPRATTGQPDGLASHPPPHTMIVRFFRRDQRDNVLRSRKLLKDQGIVISEDLTKKNQALLRKLKDSNQFKSSWSWMGKIYGIPTGQMRAVRVNIHDTFPSS